MDLRREDGVNNLPCGSRYFIEKVLKSSSRGVIETVWRHGQKWLLDFHPIKYHGSYQFPNMLIMKREVYTMCRKPFVCNFSVVVVVATKISIYIIILKIIVCLSVCLFVHRGIVCKR